jgi:hypothetical protein
MTNKDNGFPWSQRQRFLATLNGEKTDRPAFITRLETWYKGYTRSGGLPGRFTGLSLSAVHQKVGVGQLKFMCPYALKLHDVEVSAALNGEEFYREFEPVIENFPGMWDYVSAVKPGETVSVLRTPVGSLRLRHAMLSEGVFNGTEPYLKEKLIKTGDDLRVVEYILERAEFIPQYDKIAAEQQMLGENAFVVPLLHRIPFQQALLEYFGEMELFYTLNDDPGQVTRLLHLLDQQMEEIIRQIASFDWPYVEFPDNLHAMMTNPQLFRQFCLSDLQKYSTMLHAQSKKVGSHTDGNIKPLLVLLADSGLDVCESVSPYPLTECTIDQIWETWVNGPLIWGAIPSPILEETTSEAEFCAYIDHLFALISDRPIILGVVDLFMRHNSIERVASIAERLKDGL